MGLRAGRYEILRSIASGGMATVHLGRAVGAGGFERQVAIKTMHPHLAEQADFVAMFLDEARLSARVHHPNVVATLDVQQDGEGSFLVMEYVDGFALHAILGALKEVERAPSLGISLRICLDLLAGLHAAHELTDGSGAPLEVIHRDVSPHNVLVGVDGAARITDFGIARAAVRLASTREGTPMGKLRYMAPEQLGGGKLDRRADIHAAGAVLWEMLAGRRLVSGEDEGACLLEIGRPDKPSPRALDPDVPEPIAAACLRALRLDPEERYATAAAFAEAVEDAAAEAGVVVASPREVSAFVRALKADNLQSAIRDGDPGQSTLTGTDPGPHSATIQAAGVVLARAEPRSRRMGPVVTMAILLSAVAAVLAVVIWMRSPASEQAGASTATAPVTAVAPATAAPAASSADKAPQAPGGSAPPPTASTSVDPPSTSVDPPSTSLPPSTSPPPKLRSGPRRADALFRPREL